MAKCSWQACWATVDIQRPFGKPFCSHKCLMRWLWIEAPRLYEQNREGLEDQYPEHPEKPVDTGHKRA